MTCNHVEHAFFGNSICEHCHARHPSGWDCRAERERQFARIREQIAAGAYARPGAARPLIQIIKANQMPDQTKPTLSAERLNDGKIAVTLRGKNHDAEVFDRAYLTEELARLQAVLTNAEAADLEDKQFAGGD